MVGKWWQLAMMALAGTASSAAFAQSDLERLSECDAIQDRAIRLECFDRVSRQIRSQNATPGVSIRTGPSSAASAARQPRADARREFGLTADKLPQDEEYRVRPLKRLQASIKSVRPTGPYWQFTLDDGATWQTAELVENFNPPRPGEQVRVRRTALGAYLLDVGSQGSIRVNRVS